MTREPIVVGATGLLVGATALYVAWTLAYPLNQWHHGLIMLAVSFAMAGYGLGARSAQRARKERDEAKARALALVAEQRRDATCTKRARSVTVQEYRRYQALTGAGKVKVSTVQDYRDLSHRLEQLSQEDPDYDALLDEMDAVWWRLTKAEREEINREGEK